MPNKTFTGQIRDVDAESMIYLIHDESEVINNASSPKHPSHVPVFSCFLRVENPLCRNLKISHRFSSIAEGVHDALVS